ncbi:hypothetical protein [Chondromyces crocatus]|uniref:Secreted protein n=1 Tax=Chondromyces crocatus TaxID=52 RepID=A0A0K1EMX4_CHOCO|nr:hypothetical protein [Chondromyces crocatus]AKT42007.1 uncharacterized protein CMC5_062290 [Chondromyces crocatus]
MHAPRPFPARVAAALLAFSTTVGAVGACGGGPSNFPDRDAVTAAQAVWCDALAKVLGGGPKWEHLAACKAAYPTASPGYLRQMAKCFPRRLEAAGDDKTDRAQLISECNDEVIGSINEPEAAAQDLIEARCARMFRCENVPAAECKAGFTKLDGSQRVLLTTVYNGAGRYEIADCLDTASCTDNEIAGRDACYKPVTDKLLWFPY